MEVPASCTASFNQGLQNPPHLASNRRRLFAVRDVLLTLTAKDYQLYWPYVSNVWCKDNTRQRATDGVIVTYYNCRYRRPKWERKASTSDNRSRAIREGNTCQAACRVEFDPRTNIYQITGVSTSPGHTHTLDQIDKLKRNDGLKIAVEKHFNEVSNVSPAHLLVLLQALGDSENGSQQLNEAGGRYLDRKQIANWLRSWRARRPN